MSNIESIRDVNFQKKVLGIPEKYLDLHAYHKIIIEDEGCEINIETRAYGHSAYVSGIKEILEKSIKNELGNRIYQVFDII